MADLPWQDDACSLVDAFRSGERSPLEELDATLAAIDEAREIFTRIGAVSLLKLLDDAVAGSSSPPASGHARGASAESSSVTSPAST